MTISEETIRSICFDRDISYDTLASDVTEKQRDLCTADLYMYCAMLPTSTATIDDKNGNWEHKEGSVTMSSTDKKQYRLMARRLYIKWGMVPPSLSSIKYHATGMSVRRHPHKL